MSIDLDAGFEEIGGGFGFSVLDQEEKPKEMFPNGILARHFVCLESSSLEKNERAWNVVSHKWANMQPANGREPCPVGLPLEILEPQAQRTAALVADDPADDISGAHLQQGRRNR